MWQSLHVGSPGVELLYRRLNRDASNSRPSHPTNSLILKLFFMVILRSLAVVVQCLAGYTCRKRSVKAEIAGESQEGGWKVKSTMACTTWRALYAVTMFSYGTYLWLAGRLPFLSVTPPKPPRSSSRLSPESFASERDA